MAILSPTGAIGRGVNTSVTVVNRLAPGGSLEWTTIGSGLGGIVDLRLFDTLGDGQTMDTSFRPQVVIRRGSLTLFSGDLLGWSGVRNATTAATAINFDLGPTLRAAGLSSGLTTDDSTVAITFHSQISTLYAATQAPPLGRVLGQGDPLSNSALFSGTVSGALASSNPAGAVLTLPTSLLTSSIYAVNGVLVTGAAHAAFGDIVTYRLHLELPLTAAHQVQILVAAPGLPGLPGLAGAFVFDTGVRNPVPPSGHAEFGPGGSYTAAAPLVSAGTDAAGNAVLRFNFGDIQPVYGSGSGTIDLLVSAPFTPGAALAFTATETEANSFGLQVVATAPPAALTLSEPTLRIQTATVYASNDNAVWTGTGGPAGYSPDFGQFGDVISSAGLAQQPFADRLSGIDASDEVTFVIAIENLVPNAKAYGVTVRAIIPAGFVLPSGGASLSVTDGAGTPLLYSGGLFDAQGGLTLDPAAPLQGYDPASGQNILLISYTLDTADRLDLSTSVHDSTVQIVGYTTAPGGANRVPLVPAANNTATTEVATTLPGVAIALVATSDPSTAGALLALGETATFDLTVTLPEGLSRALDIGLLLPAGFTVLSARVISIGANITPQTQAADGAGGIAFGDTLNVADGQNTNADQIVVEFTVQPTQVPGGPAPHSATIQGVVSIGAPGAVSQAVASVAVIAAIPVPPAVTLALAGLGAATLLNGRTATFHIVVTLPAGVSTDFRILYSLPAGLAYVPGSTRIVQANGATSTGGATLPMPSASVAGSMLTLDFGAVSASAPNGQVVIELQASVAGATPGAMLVNSVTATTGYASSTTATLSLPVGNTPPTLTGLPLAEMGRDDTALVPFTGIGLADPDPGQAQTLTIKVSNPANGVLTNLGFGSYDPVAGVYTATGSFAAVIAAVAALRFIPTLHQANLGQAILTNLSVQAQDNSGGVSTLFVIRLTTTATDAMPMVRDAAPGQPIMPGVPIRLFTGLSLQDADAGRSETLSIQFSDPAIGVLSGTGPGHVNPVTGAFTSTGTLAALMVEAGQLLFTGNSPAGAAGFVTIAIDDGAGGVARDTSAIVISPTALGAASPTMPAVPPLQLLTGPSPANTVIVDPTKANLLIGTGSRDAYFIDGNAVGSHWDTLAQFAGADTVVLWGFLPGRSTLTWLDGSGPLGYTGRTLQVNIPSTGGTNRLTFAGLTASDTDRFAISAGRFNGLDYLSIAAPP